MLESDAAAISQSFRGSNPLILAEVAVKGPVCSISFLAVLFDNMRIAIFSPPSRLSNGFLARSIIAVSYTHLRAHET